MKKLLAVLLALSTLLALVACTGGNAPTEPTEPETEATEPVTQAKLDIDIAVMSGPTGMGAAKLMQDAADGKTANNYNFTVASAPDEVSPSIINGEFEIACIPTNLAASIFNKTQGGIKVAAVNTLGVLYLLTNGEEITSVEDLRGKTVHAVNQGSTPEYILNYVLTESGLVIGEDVTLTFSDADTVSAGLASGDITIGMLPEPKVTATLIANSDVKVALDLTEEWAALDDTSAVMQGCVVVNSAFAAENPDAVNAFLDEYKASVEYTKTNTDEAATLCETHKILPKAAIAKKAYPNCNITYIDGEEMQTKLTAFLTVLYEANAKSVGGALPGEGFYYEK